MAAIFDSESTGPAPTVTRTSITWAHTIAAESNRALFVGVHVRVSAAQTVTSVTYGGVALTLIDAWGSTAIGGTDGGLIAFYKLVAPAIGTADIVVTISANANCNAGAVSFYSVDQTTPTANAAHNNSAGSTSGSVTVTSTVDQVIVAGLTMINTGTLTATSTDADVHWFGDVAASGATVLRMNGHSRTGAASSTAMTWTLGTSRAWNAVGFAVNGAVGGAVHEPTLGHWRFYSDAADGSMVALAAEDTAPVLTSAQMQNGTLRLRAQIEDIGGAAGSGAITARYPSGTGNYNTLPNYATTTSNQGNYWLRWTDGAATAGDTITSTKLTGTTSSGKYHEVTGLSESVGASAIHELDLAINVRWPPPDVTITVEILYGGTLLSGATPITLTTSPVADRPYTIDQHDPGAAHKTSAHIGRGPWPAVFYDGSHSWFFIVGEDDIEVLRAYSWDGAGDWERQADLVMGHDADDGSATMAYRNVSGTPTFYLNWGRSTSNRYLRKGTVSGTTITWGSTTTLVQANDPYGHIGVDDGGYLWLAGINTGATIWFRRSTNVNDETAWATAVTLADVGTAANDILAVRGLASGKALIVWYRAADTSLRYAVVNSTSVLSSGTISTPVRDEDWGMTRSNGYVYLVHTNSAADGGDWVLEAFNEATDTWATGPTYDRPVMSIYSTDDGLPTVAVGNTIYTVGTDAGSWSSDRPLRITPYTGPGAGGTWGDSLIFTPSGRGNGDRVVGPLTVDGANQLVFAYDFGDDDMEGNLNVIESHVYTVSVPITYVAPTGATTGIMNPV